MSLHAASFLLYVSCAVWLSSGFLSHPRIVLRDKPVRLLISCSDSLSRKYIRRTFPNISMVITFFAPA